MRAMVLEAPQNPLRLVNMPIPEPQEGQILLEVKACAACRTDLHIFDGEIPLPRSPLILGHQVVGIVKRLGPKAKRFKIGQRVGAAWVGKTCGACRFCLSNRENLCESALFTGYHYDGGFAEFCTANEDYCYLLPDCYSDSQVAPLLCGGLIGFRALRKTGSAQKLGFYGFGSSAHILIQIAKHQGKEVYAFTRHGDESAQSLAKKLGAVWAGSSEEMPPVLLDAAIIFAPVGKLVPQALRAVDKGGSVVCAGIHMSDIPSFPYELIYGERLVQSVANLTRDDGEKFFEIASRLLIHTQVASYSLEEANRALCDLREGKITGSAVISVSEQ
ncbi:MAG: zinc-dependent alcohol dehydrogenase family protein [Parachlamydiales bacterium]|nr:zinc-dependent alcohol dehydrogenase family protein [Candidatus Acheromyda pituitae]